MSKGKVIGLDHIGLAVRDPRKQLPLWAEYLGLTLERTEAVLSEGVRTWFLRAGETHIELLEPTDGEGPIARHLDRRGEGIHHLCLQVDDLEAVLAGLAAAGIAALPPGIRPGAGGARVAFLHPKTTGGVLLELSQPGKPPPERVREPFVAGDLAVAYLNQPKERVFGVIHSRSADGLAIHGLDLDAWDDWLAQWRRGGEGPLAPSLRFYPSSRIDKLLADEDTPDLPSLERRFVERTGHRLEEALPGLREQH